MDWIQAVVLGITQGLTEFLPISSSGHLIIVPWLFDWEEPGLAFDSALHLGTLIAVFAYFLKDLLEMLKALPIALRRPLRLLQPENGTAQATQEDFHARLALLLIIGSIPGGIVGLLAQGRIEDLFHNSERSDRAIVMVSILLIAFGLLLFWADRRGREQRLIGGAGWRDALALGVAQAIALVPGVSRSGVTLTVGLFRDFKRADAARLSFLLGIPLVAAAGLNGVYDIVQADPSSDEVRTMLVGLVASAASGLIAIWFLLRFLQRSNTTVFVVYRILLGIGLILLIVTGVK